MDGFWFTIGLISGCGIGSFVGILIVALCVAAKEGQVDKQRQLDEKLFEMPDVPIHERIAVEIEEYPERQAVRDIEGAKYYSRLFAGMAREIGDRFS